jgi:hypothetical protein
MIAMRWDDDESGRDDGRRPLYFAENDGPRRDLATSARCFLTLRSPPRFGSLSL